MTKETFSPKHLFAPALILLMLVFMFILASAAVPASAAEFTADDGNSYQYEIDGGQAYITGVTLGDGVTALNIPASIGDTPVVGIEDNAFDGNDVITTVSIPASVTSIGQKAFQECGNLASVSLPRGLKSLGFAAFYNCTSLTDVVLPEDFSGTLQTSVFQNCSALTSIVIPKGVTELGGWAFCGCSSLADVTFADGSSIQTLGRQTFTDCAALTSIELPASFTSVAYDTFKNCTGLTDVWFLGDVTAVTFINWDDVQYNAWTGCENVRFHAFGKYYDGTFAAFIAAAEEPYGFTYVEIPTSVTLSSAVGASLGGHVTPAGRYMAEWGSDVTFQFTPNDGYRIASVIVDGKNVGTERTYTLTDVREDHTLTVNFELIPTTNDVTYNYEVDGGEAYITGITYPVGSAVDLVIPDTIDGYPVVGIKEEAFKGNEDITSATIPEGVTAIDQSAFYGCTALKTIDLPESLRSMGWAAFYGCSSLTEAVLPKSFSGTLQGSLFQDCTSLTRVNIPEGVTGIGGWTFCGCTALTDVYFNGVSKCASLDRQAFSGCTALKSIDLPASIASISYNSFINCTALQDVWFHGDASQLTLINWDDVQYNPWAGCSNVTFHGWNETYKGNFSDFIDRANPKYGFTFKAIDGDCVVGPDGNTYYYTINGSEAVITDVFMTATTDLVMPSEINGLTVTELGDRAFRAMGDTVLAEKPMLPYTDITSVVLPRQLEIIGKEAFYACTSVESIDMPDTVTTVRSGAFCFCTSLKSLHLSDSLVGPLGDVMFWGCYDLESVNIPDGVTSIGRWVFYDCRKLTEITIPAKITSIDKESFEQCIALKTVTFAEGSSCTSIGQQVFWNCPALETITLPDSLNFIGVETFRNCTSLQTITIPKNVSSIGVRAFQGCEKLKTATVLSDISYLDEKVFDGCSSLADVWFYGDASALSFHKSTFEGLTGIVFHGYADKSEGLQSFVTRYAEERNFSFVPITAPVTPVTPSGGHSSGGGGGSRTNSSYTITVSCSEGAAGGTAQTVTVTSGADREVRFAAADGYRIAAVVVDGKSVGTPASYTFSKVSSNHTVYVLYEKTAAAWSTPFQDVGPLDVYADAVQAVYDNGLMNGIAPDRFAPDAALTRAMLVTVLYRFAGSPSVTNPADFRDVESGAYYEDAVAWASANQIALGYGDGVFGANDNVSREQLAVILSRYMASNGYSVTADSSTKLYNDADQLAAYSTDAVYWAAVNGILTGQGNGLIKGTADATRADVAIAFAKLLQMTR